MVAYELITIPKAKNRDANQGFLVEQYVSEISRMRSSSRFLAQHAIDLVPTISKLQITDYPEWLGKYLHVVRSFHEPRVFHRQDVNFHTDCFHPPMRKETSTLNPASRASSTPSSNSTSPLSAYRFGIPSRTESSTSLDRPLRG